MATVYEQVRDEVEMHFLYLAYSMRHPNHYMRYTIEEMTEPLCNFVRNFRGPKDVLHKVCDSLVVRIAETHRMFFNIQRKQHCRNVLFHNLLYVVARVAFLAQTRNTAAVVRLLSEIFRCDKGFRTLLMGAYYEPEDCFEEAQVHSFFGTQLEGLGAFRFFLYHTDQARKTFVCNGVPRKLADLPLQGESIGHPAAYAIAAKCPRTFKLLLEHGTNLEDNTEPPTAHFLLVMIPRIVPENNTEELQFCRLLFDREHPEFLPPKERTLKMLSRRVIRRRMRERFQLPDGIRTLDIPEKLKLYLNLDFE